MSRRHHICICTTACAYSKTFVVGSYTREMKNRWRSNNCFLNETLYYKTSLFIICSYLKWNIFVLFHNVPISVVWSNFRMNAYRRLRNMCKYIEILYQNKYNIQKIYLNKNTNKEYNNKIKYIYPQKYCLGWMFYPNFQKCWLILKYHIVQIYFRESKWVLSENKSNWHHVKHVPQHLLNLPN